MASRLISGISLTLLVLTVSGCSSVRSRTEMSTENWKVYPGVRRDFSDLDDAFAGKLKGPDWTPAMVVPILLGDIPFSTIVDTAALPYDLYQIGQQDDPTP